MSRILCFLPQAKDGQPDPASSGTLVALDGTPGHLERDDVEIEVQDTFESESPAGGRYPARWRLKVTPGQQVLEIRPVLADQEFRGDARYWEGAVDVVDAKTGKTSGRGYVELTGYAPGKVEKSGN